MANISTSLPAENASPDLIARTRQYLRRNPAAARLVVIVAAVVSLVTVLTLRETAARPLAARGARAQVASAT